MSILVSAAVLVTVAYARPFVHYAQFEWQETWLDGAYTHAWLAIAVLAWLVYRAGGQDFRLRQARASWAEWGLLGLGAATKCAAVLLGHATLDGLSLVPLLLGLSGVLLPDEAARRLRFPILFLLAIVPVPNLVIDLLTGPMRGWQASGVASLFQVAGVPVTRAGYSLLLGDGAGVRELVISSGCSGIRSLVALSALAALLGHLQGLPPGRHLLLMAAGVAVVNAANFARISATALAALHWPAPTVTDVHDAAGLVVLPVMVAALVWTARRLEPEGRVSHA